MECIGCSFASMGDDWIVRRAKLRAVQEAGCGEGCAAAEEERRSWDLEGLVHQISHPQHIFSLGLERVE